MSHRGRPAYSGGFPAIVTQVEGRRTPLGRGPGEAPLARHLPELLIRDDRAVFTRLRRLRAHAVLPTGKPGHDAAVDQGFEGLPDA
ncbi:hypothetical protein [Sediminimonas sp.]|uniref:hypothetical protein n=1 Tax=Sediminimonas sp. TaxID=2823379 RepID=UPI0025EFB9E6|nr:hypothetical protein [Sediminimonas sp.]